MAEALTIILCGKTSIVANAWSKALLGSAIE
jgi:hypothetical protein